MQLFHRTSHAAANPKPHPRAELEQHKLLPKTFTNQFISRHSPREPKVNTTSWLIMPKRIQTHMSYTWTTLGAISMHTPTFNEN